MLSFLPAEKGPSSSTRARGGRHVSLQKDPSPKDEETRPPRRRCVLIGVAKHSGDSRRSFYVHNVDRRYVPRNRSRRDPSPRRAECVRASTRSVPLKLRRVLDTLGSVARVQPRNDSGRHSRLWNFKSNLAPRSKASLKGSFVLSRLQLEPRASPSFQVPRGLLAE